MEKTAKKGAKFYYFSRTTPIIEVIRESGAFLADGDEVKTGKIPQSILGFFDYVNPAFKEFPAFTQLRDNTGEIKDIVKAFVFLNKNSSATIGEFVEYGSNLGLKRSNLTRWYRGGKVRKTKHPGFYLHFKRKKDEPVLDFVVFYALQLTDDADPFPNSPSDNPLESMLITGCREIISKMCAKNGYLLESTELRLRDLGGRDLIVGRHIVPSLVTEMTFLAFTFKHAMRHGVSQSEIINYANRRIPSLHDLFRRIRYKNPFLDKNFASRENFICYALQVVFGRANVSQDLLPQDFSGTFAGSDTKVYVFEVPVNCIMTGFSLMSEDFLTSIKMFNIREWGRSSGISKDENHLVDLTKDSFFDLKKHIDKPDNENKRKRAINYLISMKAKYDIEIDHFVFLDDVVSELMKCYYTTDCSRLILHDSVIENFERYSYLFSQETMNQRLTQMTFRFV